MLMHEPAARLRQQPLGADQESDVASVTSAKIGEALRQRREVSVRQIGYDPIESGERLEFADVAQPDIVDERAVVTPDVERSHIEASAAKFE
jgi:hypothetical protein